MEEQPAGQKRYTAHTESSNAKKANFLRHGVCVLDNGLTIENVISLFEFDLGIECVLSFVNTDVCF